MKRLFFAIAILPWLLIACNTVTFQEPQPATNDTLKEIPQHLTGHYFDYDNDKDLYITPRLIFSYNPTSDTFSIDQLSSGETMKNDTLYTGNYISPYKIVRVNDSLFTGYRVVDTIFNLADAQQLLKAEGDDYFLNYKVEDDRWWVSKLAFRDGVVNITNIETENEVKMMENITNVKREKEQSLSVKPSKDEFKKFVSQSGFTKGNTYLKMDTLIHANL